MIIRDYVVSYQEMREVLGVFDASHVSSALEVFEKKYPNDDIWEEPFTLNDCC